MLICKNSGILTPIVQLPVLARYKLKTSLKAYLIIFASATYRQSMIFLANLGSSDKAKTDHQNLIKM
jgi:hypothetical protein